MRKKSLTYVGIYDKINLKVIITKTKTHHKGARYEDENS
jgi:hypothetical protein